MFFSLLLSEFLLNKFSQKANHDNSHVILARVKKR